MSNNNVINQRDLGFSPIVENCQKISVDELVRKATKNLKKRLVEAQIEALEANVKLTTSRTMFGGERLWFACPLCAKRSGILYQHPIGGTIGCRNCLSLIYKKQRYKGMVEVI